MKKEFTPDRLDVAGFAQAGATLAGRDPLASFERLAAEAVELPGDAVVEWQAAGEERSGPGGQAVPWLHLQAHTSLPLVCQRCLGPVSTPLQVDRWFRFAADEATAAAEDELAEDEDVLALSRDFDLRELLEDELLMEIPVTPRHDNCPQPVQLAAADPDFDAAEEERANPFAALEALRRRKPE